MRDYSKLAPSMWTRGSGKRLRGDAVAQVVAAYVSTAPGANMIGIYYCPLDSISHDTGHTVDVVRDALRRVERAGYAKYDFDAELVWVPNHAKIEIGREMKPGDKRRGKVLAELAQVSDHPFADEFVALYADGFAIPKGHRRGIEGASGYQDGASGILGQDRTGQDRSVTGQDRSVSAPPVEAMPTDVPQPDVGAGKKALRGSRLPGGWKPSEETLNWAREQGVGDPCGKLLDEFTDYWRGVAGQKGVKLDWDATYRNRVRQVAERGAPRGHAGPTKQPLGNVDPNVWVTDEGFGKVGS